MGAGGLGDTLVLAWELLNIDCGKKVCMLMRDRRLVGPGEPLDLVVPVLWDDRGGINARRSTSSLESAGGESSRCLHWESENVSFVHRHQRDRVIRRRTHPTRYICFPCWLTKAVMAYGEMA